MYDKTRVCRFCGKILSYSCKDSYNLSEKQNAGCKSCSGIRCSNNPRKGSCERLLENSYESFYWLGFICADGHISKNKRMTISISDKDENHLEKLAVFLKNPTIRKRKAKSEKHHDQVTIAISDAVKIRELCKLYDIQNNKTTNPVSFNKIRGLRNRLSFIAGFIDGDGSIRNFQDRQDYYLVIKCHKSWEKVLNQISKFLCGKEKTIINKLGYAYFSIGESANLKQLKRVLLRLNLPLLCRKWDVIDLSFIGKQELGKIRAKKVMKFIEQGIDRKTIKKELGIGDSAISLIVKRNRI